MCHERGVSNHSPVVYTLSSRRQLPLEQRPIPKEMFELRSFGYHHDYRVKATELSELDTMTQWLTHKKQIREAARLARNDEHVFGGGSPPLEHIKINSIARAVLYKDKALARNLLPRSSLAKKHLRCEHSRVFIHVPEMFAKVVEV